MLVGANALQRALQVPSALIIALNGLIVVFVVASEYFRHRSQQERDVEALETEKATTPSAVVKPETEG
jgi:simple sugar transport system permease protein